jgi:hypothetical protein
MRTFGSPNTPRTTGSERKPSNEYVSQSRRSRFDDLPIRKSCQISNSEKMQNTAQIPHPMTPQLFKFAHSIPRRPEFSCRLTDWRPFVIVGNTMPPRDPDADDEDEEEDDDGEDEKRDDEPPVVREPDEE